MKNADKKTKISGTVLTLLLALGFLISAVCMFILTKKGVSLRAAPIISPSPIKEDLKEMADSLFVRLLPELRPHAFVLWGVLPLTSETQKLLLMMKERYEEIYKTDIQYVPDGTHVDNEFLKHCQQPCWIQLPQSRSQVLGGNDWIENRPLLNQKTFQSVTLVYFDRPLNKPTVTQACIDEQFLDFNCLVQVSIRDAWKKMKSTSTRYFFVRQYNERDIYIFIQNAI